MGRVGRVWREETTGWYGKLLLARLLGFWLPVNMGNRFRAFLLRSAGFRIGEGSVFFGWPTFSGAGDIYSLLKMGESCWVNYGVSFNLGAEILIGNKVSLGHEVMILTESHEIGNSNRRSGPLYARSVCIGDEVWIGTRSLVLPGVTIGERSVVAAGAVVNKDVPANTLVGGVPAKVLRELDG